jgi:hypothetical protein
VEDRNKILDRIRKLFAMSQQQEESANEAAIALRRCRALMDKHGVTEADLITSEFLSLDVSKYKKRPKWHSVLVLGIAVANDCIVESVRECRGGELTTSFKGFEQDVLLAQLMFEYLTGAMDRLYKEFSKENAVSGKAYRMSFNYGFASTMQKRLFDLAKERTQVVSEETGTSLVVVKNQLVAEEFGKQCTSRRSHSVSDSGALNSGKAAAKTVGLNTQVAGSGQRLLG